MLAGWLVTLPASACMAGPAAYVAERVGSSLSAGVVTIALGVIALVIFLASLRDRVTAANVDDKVATGCGTSPCSPAREPEAGPGGSRLMLRACSGGRAR